MLEISTVRIKRVFDAGWPLRAKRPSSAGSSFALISCIHLGCVKSPVPMTVIPLIPAHESRFSSVISFDTAREYGEWMWKSATIFIAFYCMRFPGELQLATAIQKLAQFNREDIEYAYGEYAQKPRKRQGHGVKNTLKKRYVDHEERKKNPEYDARDKIEGWKRII